MKRKDSNKTPIKIIVRSILIIIWWLCVWGLTDHIIHHMTFKNPMRKIAIYIGLMLLVLGTIGLDPNILQHM
jgi:amino acid transporter